MVQYCIVSGCKEDTNTVLSFYSFPEEECMRKRWLMAIRKNNSTILENSVICCKHFLPEAFNVDALGNKTLKDDAVPSIFSIRDHYHEIERIKQRFLRDRHIQNKYRTRKKPIHKKPHGLKSRNILEKALTTENCTQNTDCDGNVEELPTKNSQHGEGLKENEDVDVNISQCDDFVVTTNPQESFEKIELPNNIVQIQRLIAHQTFEGKKQSRTLKQKIKRQSFKIYKQYKIIRELCNHLSQLKKAT